MSEMRLKDRKGLKYPDDYIIKFFFREKLNLQHGKVVEFGCGNGNNLDLFHQYGWDVTGIDIDKHSIADAKSNFEGSQYKGSYSYLNHDISAGIGDLVSGPFDVLLFPNILYYIRAEQVRTLMMESRALIANPAWVFVRNRSVKDYRYGRGTRLGKNEFRINTPETREDGLTNVFYNEYELIDLLRDNFILDKSTLRILSIDYQTADFDEDGNHVVIPNSDIVVWVKVHRSI